MALGWPLLSFVTLTRRSWQGKKPFVRNPPLGQLTAASRPPSRISDVTVRRTTRRRVCLRPIPPLQYRRISPGAEYQTQSCLLRGFGKRDCPNKHDTCFSSPAHHKVLG